jgi:hypothetical protein
MSGIKIPLRTRSIPGSDRPSRRLVVSNNEPVRNPTVYGGRINAKQKLNLTPAELVRFLDEATGKEWRDWDSLTLRDYFDLENNEVRQLDKLMACQVAATNPDVFEDWHLFQACIIAFNDRRVNFNWFDKPSYLELAWGCECLKEITPNVDFGPGVKKFIEAICIDDGVVYFPWAGIRVGRINLTLDGNTLEQLKVLTPSSVNEEDIREVQMLKVVLGHEYVRRAKNVTTER